MMTKRSRRIWIGAGVVLVMVAASFGGVWWFKEMPSQPALPIPSNETPAAEASSPMPMKREGVMISPRKQQLIGVKTELAEVRSLTHTIRTVGLVEVDERLLNHMHTKFEGWIQNLYVKFTGESVEKGQMLFEIYSPELVSTQEE